VQVFWPPAAAVGEVLAMGDQALMQVAGEQRDAFRLERSTTCSSQGQASIGHSASIKLAGDGC
jgi:hypothetical protein